MDRFEQERRSEEDVLREGTEQLLRLYDSSGRSTLVFFRCRRQRDLDAGLVLTLAEQCLDGPVVSGGYEIQDVSFQELVHSHVRSLQILSSDYGSDQTTGPTGNPQETGLQYKSDSTGTLWRLPWMDRITSQEPFQTPEGTEE